MQHILRILNVTKSFEGTIALDDFSLDILEHSITGIIGPNGAGKTTLFDIITGFVPFYFGKIIFKDTELGHLSPYQITGLGIARAFQQLRLISRLSILDNFMLSFQDQSGESLRKLFFYPWKIRQEEIANYDKAMHILRLLGLEGKERLSVEELSYGQKKLVSLGCCLACDADLLLLDEPIAGITPTRIEAILSIIKGLLKKGKTILIIEHNVDAIADICDRMVFMVKGQKIIEGSPKSVRYNPCVLEEYLG